MALDVTLGGLDSNSYVTVAEADAYITANLDKDAEWDDLLSGQKEQLLIKAALILEDFKFGGDRTVVGQSLAFPRINLCKYENPQLPVASTIIPYQIKNAQCELVLWMFLSRGVDEYSSVSMAGLSVSKGLINEKDNNKIPEIVFILIKPFFKNLVNSAMISVSRSYPANYGSTPITTPTCTPVSIGTSFLSLLDTPSNYTDAADKFVKVKSDGTGLEFTTSSTVATWGGVVGTLSDQVDLQAELDAKAAETHTHTELHEHSNKSTLDTITSSGDGLSYLANDGTYKTVTSGTDGAWGSITGTLSDQTDLTSALNAKADSSALHSHTNKTALDAIITSGSGTSFLSDDGTYKAGTEEHTHTNKTLLDGIISSGDGSGFLSNDGTYKAVSAGSATWGSITGTLSNQTDLVSALDLKADTSSLHSHTNKTLLDSIVSDNVHTHTNKSAIDVVTSAGSSTEFLAGDGVYRAAGTSYTHPTTDGSLHVPATGTTNSGKVLTAGATAGSFSWETATGGSAPSDTAYDATTWDANQDAATKNAIRDKFVSVDAAISSKADTSSAQTFTNKTYTGVVETHVTLTSASGVLTIDCAAGNSFAHTFSANVTTLTLSNVPASGKVFTFALKLIRASSAYTMAWPTSFKWAGGTAPTLSSTTGNVDVFMFYTHDGGTTWYSFVAGQVMS